MRGYGSQESERCATLKSRVSGKPGQTEGKPRSPPVTANNCGASPLVKTGGIYICAVGYDLYTPQTLVYTDPYGRVYAMGGDGSLNSVQDVAGNTLSVTAAGICAGALTASGACPGASLSVPFVRDAQGRITRITDPLGNQYEYGYDASGNLASVTYPGVATPAQYTYDPTHLYTGGTDPRGNALPSTTYYPDGKLQSVTVQPDPTTSYTTSYQYDTTTPAAITYPDNTTATGFKTTITYPDQGKATLVYDLYGMLISSTDPLHHTTLNQYDANHNLTSVTDPSGHTTTYTYDSNGNRTSVTYPSTAPTANTTSRTEYNAHSEPTRTTDELGNVRTFTYDANFWPGNLPGQKFAS